MLYVYTAFCLSKFNNSLRTAVKCKAKIGPFLGCIHLLYPKKCYLKKCFVFFQAVLSIKYNISKSYFGAMCLQPSRDSLPPCYYRYPVFLNVTTERGHLFTQIALPPAKRTLVPIEQGNGWPQNQSGVFEQWQMLIS